MNPAITISSLVSVIFLLSIYMIFVPKNNNIYNYDDDSDKHALVRMSNSISNEFYSALPAGIVRKQKIEKTPNPRLESLLVRSGNPWGLKASEFMNIQIALAVFGLIAGAGIWFLLQGVITVPWWSVSIASGVFAFFVPKLKYEEEAKKRDLEFKRQLPEALDLLVISLGGGRTFEVALREVIPNMKSGILKEEFRNIVKQLNSGTSLDQALDSFANRAPNQSIEAFIKSVKAATEVNSPLIETLEARADSSRKEFFALVQEKIAQLPSKISMALAPTFLPAVLIVSVAPSIMSMMQSLN